MPRQLATVAEAIRCVDGAEIAGSDPIGKFVVTLETGTQAEIVRSMNHIESLPGVINTALVYHYTESNAHDSSNHQQPEDAPHARITS